MPSARSFRGATPRGDTYEEVIHNIRDAIKLHIEDRLASGEDVVLPQSFSLTTLEVAV